MLIKLRQLPDSPGVYQFFDKNGRLLYVGKAKSLKNRVRSYFRFSPALMPAPNLGVRIRKMVEESTDLEYIILNSESDALILENSLIKQLKPKYNILLRDDKTYPYIFVDLSEEFPRFEITRKIVSGSMIKYFGPFVTGAKELLEALYENFMLVQKKGCLNGKKACLFYQIGRCPAPCEKKIDSESYKKIVSEAMESIHNPKELIERLTTKMERLSDELRFEEAASIRDKLLAIKKIAISSEVDFAKDENFDLFAVAKSQNIGCVVRFFVRAGKLISSSHSFASLPDGADDEAIEELYSYAIMELYSKEHPFDNISVFTFHELKDRELLEELAQKNFGKRLKISTPKKKEHKNIAQIALKNGFELLRQKGESPHLTTLSEIRDLLGFESQISRIEVFDNSHLFGSFPVASMVVWEDGFKKEEYRHYNLESKNEYEQMREVLTRRALSFDTNPPPDMWLLDGGKANLNLARDILSSTGVHIELVAISKEKIDGKAHRAKNSANDIIYTLQKVYKLPATDRRLQFLQKLRDEAHRFAVEFHRKQKRKRDKEIELMNLKGIKEGKIKRLMNYFGTFEAIERASLAELETVLPKRDARMVYEFYNGSR